MDRKFRVIVADDEKLIANNLARRIEQGCGAFEVAAKAGTGLEALELTRSLLPDVVFSDIKMPEMDGIALIEQIKKHAPGVLTVIISGYSDFEYARAAIRHGAADYLLKPVNPDELRRLLNRLEAILMAREQQVAPRREASPAEIVNSVVIYLQDNYDKQIDFTHIAGTQAVSAPYLSRIFHEQVGVSPSRYLAEYRMQQAKKLLRDTRLSIREVAERVGYTDQFHFSKSFKNAVGLSPAQFRERYAKRGSGADGAG